MRNFPANFQQALGVISRILLVGEGDCPTLKLSMAVLLSATCERGVIRNNVSDDDEKGKGMVNLTFSPGVYCDE